MAYTSGWPGTDRSLATTMRPPLVSSTPSISASGLARTPGRPDDDPGRENGSVGEMHETVIAGGHYPVDADAEADLDPAPGQRPPRPLAALVAHRRQEPGRGFHEDDSDGSGRRAREVLGQHPGEQLHHRPGGLDAGRPAATEHDVELAALDHRGIGGRALESFEHVAAQVEGVVEGLERDRVLLDAVDPEVGRHGAGGETSESYPISSVAPLPRSSRSRFRSRSTPITVAIWTLTLRCRRNTPRTA